MSIHFEINQIVHANNWVSGRSAAVEPCVGREEAATKHAKGTEIGERIVFKEEIHRIIGACFEVYKEKGNGFLINLGCSP